MGVYPHLVKSNKPSPKKRFGQHFLRDTGVIERIVRWLNPAPEDILLEVGAGPGPLSSRLAPRVARFLAVEIDSDCIPLLENALEPFPSSVVIRGDILQLDLTALAAPYLNPDRPLRIIGNLPYNIATAIIEQFLHLALPIRDMFFMVQLEVAQRIAALPGSRQYGFLSVQCQHCCDVQLAFKVSPACFVPRPQVSSAMISLRPKRIDLDPAFESVFTTLVKAAFSYRRKTMANSFARDPLLGSISPALLGRSGIEGSRRAEQLSVQEYEHLARTYRNEFSNT
jgi:16S rRNA (adenine1518-N6/adenine1519-N6)-dimethyltransferase